MSSGAQKPCPFLSIGERDVTLFFPKNEKGEELKYFLAWRGIL
jgi:hypothetical protein